MIKKNGITYDYFMYRYIWTKENQNKTTTEKVIEQTNIYDEVTLKQYDEKYHSPFTPEGAPTLVHYNDWCQEWEFDGGKCLEYIMGFVSLNQ